MTLDTIPTDKGTYILVLHLADAAQITVGKRGTFAFPAGWYAYVGSAFGAGGLRGRLKHHLTPVNNPHWHIDYLRTVATVRHVWGIVSETVYEHRLAAVLATLPGASLPAPRFGASDCQCAAHLIHMGQRSEIKALQEQIRRQLVVPDIEPLV